MTDDFPKGTMIRPDDDEPMPTCDICGEAMVCSRGDACTVRAPLAPHTCEGEAMRATYAEKVYGAPAEWQQGATNYAGGTPAQAYERSRRIDQDILSAAGEAARADRPRLLALMGNPLAVWGFDYYTPGSKTDPGTVYG